MRKNTLFLALVLAISPVILKSQNASINRPDSPPDTNKIAAPQSEEFETILSDWYSALDNMQVKIGASDADYKTFLRFDKATIENETSNFFTCAKSGRINSSNVSSYINTKMEEFGVLYEKFMAIAREFPSSVDEYSHPLLPPVNVCNPGCSNIGFEDGNLSGWYAYYGINSSTTSRNITGVTGGAAGAVQKAALDPNTGSTYQVHITSGTHTDWFLDNYSTYTMSQVSPYGGNYSCMIGDSTNNGKGVAILEQTFEVDTSNPNLTIQFALFMELPTHTYYEQPFFKVFFLDAAGDTIRNCGSYQIASPNPDSAYKSLHPLGFVGVYYSLSSRKDTIYWKDWTTINVNLTPYIGQCITVGFEVADCEPSAHCAWAYVDASCTPNNIITSSPAFCGQDSIILTAPPGFVGYKWYGGPVGGIHGVDTLQRVQIDSVGTYSVVATPITGKFCADTISIYIPKVTGTPPHPTFTVNQSGCSGQQICFTNTSSPDSAQGAKFYWDFYNVGIYNDSISNPCWVYNASGTYTIKLHEIYNGCGADTFVTITVAPVNANVVVNSNSGSCINSGSATVTPCGGKLPYTYSWSPHGGSASTATGLSAGTYTITVKDNAGLSSTAAITITSPGTLTSNTTLISNATACGNNGIASISASGGTPPYTYSWNPGSETNAIATGLSGGTYSVLVTDNTGCQATSSVTITQPPPTTLGITIANVNDISCFGGNGNATANSATGGSGPYTYSWSPGGGTNQATIPVGEGTYTITVTDNIGCTATATATITQPPSALGVTISSVSNIGCYGGTGSITANAATGGTPPYSYTWSPAGGTNLITSGLSAGTYTLNILDNNGCNARAFATITQPVTGAGVSISSITNISCYGGTGSITATATTGGSLPYTYSWSPIGGSNLAASGLSTGTYTIYVTDNDGCSASASAIITQPLSAIEIAISSIMNVGCDGGTGSLTANSAIGGTSPYTYSWSPAGGTGLIATGLSAGTYTIVATDNNGCSSSSNSVITQPANALGITIFSVMNISCNGQGSATANSASGGTSPYTYSWSSPGGSDQIVTGLSAGTYTITVTDYDGCSASASAIITQPISPLGISIATITNISCSGGTGSTTANNASGGTSPYTYSWSSGAGSTISATNLSAGTYTITVTDNNGCNATANAIISQPANALSITISSVSNVSCFGGTGSTTANNAIGGTSPYTYSWSSGAGSTINASSLSTGTYTITVTDNNGCTASAYSVITQPAAALGISLSSVTNISCNGEGSATATTATGGTSPYTYSWSPSGGSGLMATGLIAGTYTISVVDSNNCSTFTTAAITQPANSLGISILSIINASCFGGGGSVTANSASGGTAPYTYSWSPGGATGLSETGLSAGTYTISVVDNTSCVASASVTISQPANALSIGISSTENVSCFGGTGSATSNAASGGTSPYTYSWSSGAGTGLISSGLSAGIYTITVLDSNRCTASAITTITEPASALGIAISSITNISCNGEGSATASAATGGTSPYTYSWSSGSTNLSATGLSAGTFTITAIDNNSCSATASVTITQPANSLGISIATITNVNCFGGTGSATANASSGGTSPYTYSWSASGGTYLTITSISAGTYTITATDNQGCSASATAVISQPANALNMSISAIINCSCFGGTGSATANASTGGTPPYTYSWSSGSTGLSSTGLSAGTYTITVADIDGCRATADVTITQPASALGISILSVSNISCNGSGSITATIASGGTSPYTYSWSSGGGTTISATGLSAGTYIITASDNHGCTATASATVTQPANSLGITIASVASVSCYGGTGTATANAASGGTSPYTYSWSSARGTNLISTGLSAGTYTFTVTDNNGCTTSIAVTLSQPASALGISISSVNPVSCFGGTGNATANAASGGTSPYSYSWSSGNTNLSVTGLSAGTYTITAIDNHNCSATAVTTITQPASALGISILSVVNINCNGAGSATANAASGGTSPYTYSWSPGGSTNLSATGLSSGTYTITATDHYGCTASTSATITQPANALGISISTINNVSCFGGTGNITSNTASGGTSPYTYSWSSGHGTNLTATGLSAGTYTIIVTDNQGCTSSASATISQPANTLSLNISVITNVSCFGGTGNITANAASGGTPPYTYSWSSGGGTSLSATGLSAGTYTINATDNHDCSTTTTATITQPASSLVISILSVSNISCGGEGSIIANPAYGGTSPYTYSWSSNGATTISATGLSAGTYTITATDNHGCSATASATITQPANSLGINIASTTNILCFGGTGNATADAASGGTSPYTYSWSSGGGSNLAATDLVAGIYTITVTDNHGCIASALATISQPANPLGVDISSVSNVSCYGGTGSATANVATGGTLPYTYSWSTGNTNLIITGMSAGTFTLHVTDNNGCSSSAIAVIAQPPSSLGIGIITINNVTYYGGSNGSITASSSTGGTSPYTYSWSGGEGTNLSATGLGAGIYTITATDNNGCTATASATITQPLSSLGITILSVTNVKCSGGLGSITANVASGGTSPYTYSWSPGGETSSTITVSAGTYTITVTDNFGVTATASTTITQPATVPGITIASHTNASCNGSNGSATANAATGGTSPYSYSWSPGGGTSLFATGLSAGVYYIVATDHNGCTATAYTTLTQPTLITATTIIMNNVSCSGNADGLAKVGTSGGVLPYTYSWSPNNSSTYIANGLSAGIYIVSVTDNNGCSATASVSITQPLPLRDSVARISKIVCVGGSTVATIGVKGGTPPYTYSWNPSVSSTATATGLTARNYSIIVKDSSGCSSAFTFSITQPESMRDSIVHTSIVNVLCYGSSDGSAMVGVKFGTQPYTYSWSSLGGSNSSATGLRAGSYTVTVKDSCGDLSTISVVITQPARLLIVADSLTDEGHCTGSIWANVHGGIAPYTYLWTGGLTTDTITNQCAGYYCCTVRDANGCKDSVCITITSATGINEVENSTEEIMIYPNPNTGQFAITGLEQGMNLEIYDAIGRRIINQIVLDNKLVEINISTRANGIYLVRIKDKNGNFVFSRKIIKMR